MTSELLNTIKKAADSASEAFIHLTDGKQGLASYQVARRALDNSILKALHHGAPRERVAEAAGIPVENLPRALRRMAKAGSTLAAKYVEPAAA